jgi:transposase InsO family protein
MIDIFSKFISVIPMKSKSEGDVLAALLEGFQEMKGTPKMIYSDEETTFMSKYTQDLFKEKNITHITTRGHAPYAERAIRTIKKMIYDRLDHFKDIKQWTDVLNYVLITYNYKLKSSVTKMTPNDARKDKNILEVKNNLELHRVHKRKYPDISVGDRVKIYTKKTLKI